MTVLDCRFYEKELPDIDDLVLVQVFRIEEHGAYVSLLEYDGMEGMILMSELSKRRIRSISKVIRVGQIQCCAVLRTEKGNVDLSKKRVSAEEARAFEVKFANAKAVQSIMKHIATQTGIETETICRLVSWPLYRSFGNPLEALRRLASGNGSDILALLRASSEFTPAIEKSLTEIVSRKMTPQPVKIRADIEVSCFGYRGVDAIKTALLEGKTVSTSEAPLSIRLVSPPQYMIVTSTFNKETGFKTVEQSISIIEKRIEALGGKFTIKQKPQTVGEDVEEVVVQTESETSSSSSGNDDSSEDQ